MSMKGMGKKGGKKVKIGIAGVGRMGTYHANVLAILNNEVDFVGVYDIDGTRSRFIAENYETTAYENLDQLIERSEGVVVAVPTHLHFDVAKKALLAAKHTLVEKPMCRTVEEAEELVRIAREKKLVFQTGHVERFKGAVTDVDVVTDLMIHDIDIVLGLMKSEVKHLDAVGQVVKSPYEDIATAILQFENGTIANVSASRLSETKIRAMAISQDKAFIYLNFETQDINIYRGYSPSFFVSSKEITYKQESFVERVLVQKDNALKEEIQHFAHCILGKSEPIVSGEDDIKTLAIALKIIEKINEKNRDPDGRLHIKAPSGTVG
jgi:predicted dehydrogenase